VFSRQTELSGSGLRLAIAGLLAGTMSLGLGGNDVAANDLKVGDPAPAFSLPGSDGKTHTLKEYRGKVVVLAWFPKAFTGG
jgi:peroxiredoxin Q/BCP